MRVVELSNSENWDSIYYQSVTAVQVPMQNGRYLSAPIPEIIVPFILEHFIIAVNIETIVPENSSWRFAGYCLQKINAGLVVGGTQDVTRAISKPLFLDQINLLLFERISTTYSIGIKLPKWFTSAVITIWQYTGVDSDSVYDLVSEIKTVDLPRIEAKIDGL